MEKALLTLACGLALVTGAGAFDGETGVQSLMLRGVIVTHHGEASIRFYRDILGQTIVERRALSATSEGNYLDVSADARIEHLIFKGSAEYPGGPIQGGRMSLITIDDPKAAPPTVTNRRAAHGDVIFPHRVSGIDEIYRRIKDAGIEVIHPPKRSLTGRSRTMMVYDPTGQIIELFELNDPRSPSDP